MRLHAGVLLLLLIAITAMSGCLKTAEDSTQLSIATIDLSADQVKSSSVEFNVTAYIENYGKTASKNTSILLKAYDDQNGLLEKQIRSPVGGIGAHKTVSVNQSLVLPRIGKHNIQISIYEGDTWKASRMVSISNLDRLETDVKDIGIEIEDIDFLVRNASNRKVVIESDIYFTNEGSDNSSAFDVLVKVREANAGLIADKKWLRLGSIKPEMTMIRSINLTVPDQYNYVVEVQVWSEGSIVKRGEGLVLLKPEMIKLAEGESVQSRPIDTGAFKTDLKSAEEYKPAAEAVAEGKKFQPGFEILMAALAAAVAIMLRRRTDGR
jgi:hypothetical protein